MRDKSQNNMCSSVERVERCELTLNTGAWAFAADNKAAIAEHWIRRKAEMPGFFNGRILMSDVPVIEKNTLRAAFMEVDFAAHLYWRDSAFPDQTIRDTFGSALVLSLEGHVLLGRQSPGNINAGLTYLPSGFIDPRDVDGEGKVDIDSSVGREFAEETGLSTHEFSRRPGYIVTRAGCHVAITIAYQAALPSSELASKMRSGLASAAERELSDVVVVRDAADLDALDMPPCAEVLLRCFFGEHRQAQH